MWGEEPGPAGGGAAGRLGLDYGEGVDHEKVVAVRSIQSLFSNRIGPIFSVNGLSMYIEGVRD